MLTFLELTSKFSLSVVYVQALLLVCTSTIKFVVGGDFSPNNLSDEYNLNDEMHNFNFMKAQVLTFAKGGILTYLLGVTVGILSLILIRIDRQKLNPFLHNDMNGSGCTGDYYPLINETSSHDSKILNYSNEYDLDGSKTQFGITENNKHICNSPPGEAFQMSWDKNVALLDEDPIIENDQSESNLEPGLILPLEMEQEILKTEIRLEGKSDNYEAGIEDGSKNDDAKNNSLLW
eukprot:CAMPEP_0184861184 /NCGR_PEP_ID=MMETSP0580-20130426/5945_1 /TAXON_ID=1118495 /ORGANISM="Dactyliosolen fragilissimus" /LENGTH=233 /DNA_ID=CAMNT_0027358603 /DNA_START=510 /DNA_END=1208 /DNA_ORIENTATION=-